MELSTKPILPGSFVVVKDTNSIYRGYKGFVQRVTKKRAAVLFEGGNWDKLITFQLTNLENAKNNLLIIELFKNQKKVLIPFVEKILPFVDIKKKFLIVNPPKGLFEL